VKKLFFLVACLQVILFTACTRISTTEIGGGLIPPIDGVTTFDSTFTITSDVFEDPDTARIYKGDTHLLGFLNDPLFGTTKASMFFELKPIFFPYFFPVRQDSIVLDSVVLMMKVTGVYGDSTKPLTINVNEINQFSKVDYLYTYPAAYPGLAAPSITTGASLGSPFVYDLRRVPDSINNRFENAKNQLRIKLDNSFGRRLLQYDTSNAYSSDSALRTYFAGFGVTTTSNGNALLKINIQDTNTKLALYYNYKRRDTANNGRDTTVSYFRFNNFGSGDANFVVRSRANSQLATYLNSTTADSLIHLETNGTFARLRVNEALKQLSNNIVHKAEITVIQVQDQVNIGLDDLLTHPRYLLLCHYDSTVKPFGIKRNIPHDYQYTSDGPNIGAFGGFTIFKDMPPLSRVVTYTFDVSRYVQGIITRKEPSYDLRLYAPSNDSLSYSLPYPNNTSRTTVFLNAGVGNEPCVGRVRLGGGTHSRYRMRLRVIYSKL